MRVLVVEDDLETARLLRRTFVEQSYAVDVVGEGPQAVWQASEFDYDAIVLDVMLPGYDGFEVCERLRRADRWAPVLMLTARDEVGYRVRGLDVGADDYVVKPFSFAEVSARLRALIRRGARPRASIVQEGDLRLDPARHRAWRGEVELDLSPREFALLHLLLHHPGEVLTRTEILERVWDFGYEGMSNVVDQYVGYLRRKIDRPFGRDDLQTVRGVGYRLSASEPQPRLSGRCH